jgi:acyl carrier protein
MSAPGEPAGRLAPASPDNAAGLAGVTSELRQILATITGTTEPLGASGSTPLLRDGIGLDSLGGTMLLLQVKQRFGVDVADEDLNLDALATLGTLAAFVHDAASRPAGNA